jgi:predicted exporter
MWRKARTNGKCLLNFSLTAVYVAYLMTMLVVFGLLGISIMAMPQRFGLPRSAARNLSAIFQTTK